MTAARTNLRPRWFLMFAAVAVLIGVGSWYRQNRQPDRVRRKHSDTVSKEFEHLAQRIYFSGPGDTQLSRHEAEQDLDELEWLLENRYSYLKLKRVDYKAALDSIRSSLAGGINRSSFGYQLAKFIALFGDGHSRIASSTVQLKSLCSGFLPFLVEESGGRLVAFKADRSGFVDPNFPFLRGMDGLAVGARLRAAGLSVARGSPQFVRYHAIRNLRYVECLRKELGLSGSGTVEVQLESADGSSTERIELPLLKEAPVYGFWPRPETEIKSLKDVRIESHILPGNIGYLRIVAMLDEAEFLDDLVEAMKRFKDIGGLIIDIRSNGGGSRAPLRALLPFFMADGDLPRVVNVAAYRLGTENIKEDFEARYLYPASSPNWSKAERAVIGYFAATFQPEWMPPQGQFSRWHYFVISPTNDRRYYHYNRPVVMLMDRGNFSACDIFLGAFKGWENVTLMGLPSGGGSGCRKSYRLGNSRIRIYLSSMASFRPSGQLYDGNGVEPDVIVEPIPTDFIGETDTVLEAAIARLRP